MSVSGFPYFFHSIQSIDLDGINAEEVIFMSPIAPRLTSLTAGEQQFCSIGDPLASGQPTVTNLRIHTNFWNTLQAV